MLSHQLRTKEIADHAGLSQQLVLLKDLVKLVMEISKASPNNNLLIAPEHMET